MMPPVVAKYGLAIDSTAEVVGLPAYREPHRAGLCGRELICWAPCHLLTYLRLRADEHATVYRGQHGDQRLGRIVLAQVKQLRRVRLAIVYPLAIRNIHSAI